MKLTVVLYDCCKSLKQLSYWPIISTHTDTGQDYIASLNIQTHFYIYLNNIPQNKINKWNCRTKTIVRGNIIYHVSASVSVQSTSRDTVCWDNAWTYGRCTARIVQPRWKKARYDILKWTMSCSVLFFSYLFVVSEFCWIPFCSSTIIMMSLVISSAQYSSALMHSLKMSLTRILILASQLCSLSHLFFY